jgi:large subunit ribosomal protein L24
MAHKFHIKRGDQVVVISGAHKGKAGKVLEIVAAKQRARVEGLALVKRHTKPQGEQKPGGIIEREGTIHVSNLMKQADYDSSKRAKAPAEK